MAGKTGRMRICQMVFVVFVVWMTGAALFPVRVEPELRIGSAKTDITPELPVALSGQFSTRIAKSVESPVMAAAVVVEKLDAEENRSTRRSWYRVTW